MAKKLQKRCMAFKILTLACSIASEDGIFTLNALRKAIKEEYPMFDRIFVTEIGGRIKDWKNRGYIEHAGDLTGIYRILPDTLDQCLDELTSTPSKIPQYFASI